MEERINKKIDYLNNMYSKYEELNQKTNNKYKWRLESIQIELEALENILNNVTGEYDEAYEEDLKEK